jgi:methylenetetrahydrofolate dehydrogenase (NADP+)/methenyltetrahydrofolate cyclohydrolase/formyltetrahydrofolate synthetase
LNAEIATLRQKYPNWCPHLAIIQVGTRDDSTVYVNMKRKAAEEVGSSYLEIPSTVVYPQ